MATLLSDNFNRADNSTVIGAPQTGPTPTIITGAGGISGNQLYSSAANQLASWALGTPDVELSATLNSLGAGTSGYSLVFGIVDSSNYWYVNFSTTIVTIVQVANGNAMIWVQETAKCPAANGSVVKAHHKGGIIRAYVDGVQVLQWSTGAPLTSGNHGTRTIVNTARLDNLLGVDAPVLADTTTGNMQTLAFGNADYGNRAGFVYRGRDTKTQDDTAGA